MAVYVDDMNLRADVPDGDRVVHGKWSHLTADSEAELRAFAETIGRQEWIQHPGEPGVHFDVTASVRERAIRQGAQPITWREAGQMYAAQKARERARAAERGQPASGRQLPAEGRVRHSWGDGPDGTRTCQREGCGMGAEQRWNPATGRPVVIYTSNGRSVVAERVPPCGSELPDPGVTAQEAQHLAEAADRKAGEAFRAGDLDRAFRLVTDARVLDPGRAQLWNRREAQIRAKTNQPVKAAGRRAMTRRSSVNSPTGPPGISPFSIVRWRRHYMLMHAVDTRAVKVQAGGAMWRLRSLTAMGHSNLRMARALGVHKDVVNRLVAGDVENITAGLFRAVDALWEAWWDKRPPERNQHERIAASKARNKARARKWPTPLNLDEDRLDETGYRPTALWHPAAGLGIASDYPLGIREAA